MKPRCFKVLLFIFISFKALSQPADPGRDPMDTTVEQLPGGTVGAFSLKNFEEGHRTDLLATDTGADSSHKPLKKRIRGIRPEDNSRANRQVSRF